MKWLPEEPRLRWGLALLLGAVFVLFLVKLGMAVNDPFFEGDAGHRMNNAFRPLARVGNRIWLPFLQIHIWALYKLHAPAWAFKLIPCFYFLAGAGLLALLAWRIIGRVRGGVPFALVLLFCFAYYPFSQRSPDLYQEVIGTAFLYLLVLGGMLDLRPRLWLLPVAAVAMLAREIFWIYLLALSVLYWRRILFERRTRLVFLTLWAVPVGWLLAMPIMLYLVDGQWPSFPIEWPLMINKDSGRTLMSSTTLMSLVVAMKNSRAYFAILAFLAVWLIGRSVPKQQPRELTMFPKFSLLSLSIAYLLVAAFDPWEVTFGNPRQLAAIAQHVPIWSILMFFSIQRYPAPRKAVATVVLILGLLLTANPRLSNWLPDDHTESLAALAEFQRTIESVPGDSAPEVCFVGVEYFRAIGYFVGPALYVPRTFPDRKDLPGGCGVVVGDPAESLDLGPGFVRSEITVDGTPYSLYGRQAPRESTRAVIPSTPPVP